MPGYLHIVSKYTHIVSFSHVLWIIACKVICRISDIKKASQTCEAFAPDDEISLKQLYQDLKTIANLGQNILLKWA